MFLVLHRLARKLGGTGASGTKLGCISKSKYEPSSSVENTTVFREAFWWFEFCSLLAHLGTGTADSMHRGQVRLYYVKVFRAATVAEKFR
jgi:hypothetical protein